MRMNSREIWPYVGTTAELRLNDSDTISGWISCVDRSVDLEPDEVPYVYVQCAPHKYDIAIDIREVVEIVPIVDNTVE